MAKKMNRNILPTETMSYLRKCKYCKGKLGKEKNIYDTLQSAIDMAKHLKEEEGKFLNVYKCPHNFGWHLTTNDTTTEIEIIGVPPESANEGWQIEYEPEGKSIIPEDAIGITKKGKKHDPKPRPIVKIECNSKESKNEVTGKIMEIVDNVNIEKMFNISMENVIGANMVKRSFDGPISQMTMHIENKEIYQRESYTVLLKKDLLKNNKLVKGNVVKINIMEKVLNNKHYWFCNKIENIDK